MKPHKERQSLKVALGALLALWSTSGQAGAIPGLKAMLQDYAVQYESYAEGSDELAGDAAMATSQEIIDRTFASRDSGEYENTLRAIDEFDFGSPYAKADLETNLQLEWERRYFLLSYQEHRQELRYNQALSQVATGMVRLAVPTTGMMGAAAHAREYFNAFKLGGGFLGLLMASREAFSASEQIPTPPAAFMELAIPTSGYDAEIQDEALGREVNSDRIGAASMVASTGLMFARARRVAMVVRGAAIVGDVSLGAGAAGGIESLGATLLLGIAVDQLATYAAKEAMESYARREIHGTYLEAAEEFIRSTQGPRIDAHQALSASRALLRAALRYEAFAYLPVLEQLKDFERSGGTVPEEVAQLLRGRDRSLDRQVALHIARQTLAQDSGGVSRAVPPEADAALKEAFGVSFTEAIRANLDGYGAWSLTQPGGSPSDVKAYLARRDARLDAFLKEQLVQQLKAKALPRDPFVLLWETAALLRSTGRPFLVAHADRVLMSRVNKYILVNQLIGAAP